MRAFRGLRLLSAANMRSIVRSKLALFWILAFPTFLLLVFAFIFGGGESDRVTYLLPGLWTITVISSTFFGGSMSMVQAREDGTFRRFWVTPITGATVVSSFAVVQISTLTAAVLLQGLVAWAAFRVDPAGSVWDLVPVFAAGMFGFIPLGLIVGSIARDMKTAPVITNILFFPLMFLSGAAVPFFVLPEFVQGAARLLPATYLNEALQGVMVRGESAGANLGPIAVLLLTGVVGLSLNSLLFRWEKDQPIDRRNMIVALGGLLLLYALAALFAPELRMTERPGG